MAPFPSVAAVAGECGQTTRSRCRMLEEQEQQQLQQEQQRQQQLQQEQEQEGEEEIRGPTTIVYGFVDVYDKVGTLDEKVGAIYLIDRSVVAVGRGNDCDIQILNEYKFHMSRVQFQLRYESYEGRQGVCLVERGNKHHTRIGGGRRLKTDEKRFLEDQATILVGQTVKLRWRVFNGVLEDILGPIFKLRDVNRVNPAPPATTNASSEQNGYEELEENETGEQEVKEELQETEAQDGDGGLSDEGVHDVDTLPLCSPNETEPSGHQGTNEEEEEEPTPRSEIEMEYTEHDETNNESGEDGQSTCGSNLVEGSDPEPESPAFEPNSPVRDTVSTGAAPIQAQDVTQAQEPETYEEVNDTDVGVQNQKSDAELKIEQNSRGITTETKPDATMGETGDEGSNLSNVPDKVKFAESEIPEPEAETEVSTTGIGDIPTPSTAADEKEDDNANSGSTESFVHRLQRQFEEQKAFTNLAMKMQMQMQPPQTSSPLAALPPIVIPPTSMETPPCSSGSELDLSVSLGFTPPLPSDDESDKLTFLQQIQLAEFEGQQHVNSGSGNGSFENLKKELLVRATRMEEQNSVIITELKKLNDTMTTMAKKKERKKKKRSRAKSPELCGFSNPMELLTSESEEPTSPSVSKKRRAAVGGIEHFMCEECGHLVLGSEAMEAHIEVENEIKNIKIREAGGQEDGNQQE